MYDRIVLVDTENVGEMGLHHIPTLTKNDLAVILYSVHSCKISIGQAFKIRTWECEVEARSIQNGTANALDFVLVSNLGYYIGKEAAKSYIIISNDTGYTPVVNIWRSKGYDIRLYGSSECLKFDIEEPILQNKEMNLALPDYRIAKKLHDAYTELDEGAKIDVEVRPAGLKENSEELKVDLDNYSMQENKTND